jgi:CRP/FNR family transcriptional regulator, cyclic AMP receptor protein
MGGISAGHTATLRAGAWFSSLPAALQDALLAYGVTVQIASGERLFAKDDPPDGLYAVLSGGMSVSGASSEGREAILAIAEPPMWFGEIALFDRLNRTHDAWANQDSTLMRVPIADFDRLTAEHPEYWQEFGRLLTQKLRQAFTFVEHMALHPPAARLALRLLAMWDGYGERKGLRPRELKVSQDQLGMMLALTRQTVNQLLRQFEAAGAIALGRGSIELIDVALLKELAARESSVSGV